MDTEQTVKGTGAAEQASSKVPSQAQGTDGPITQAEKKWLKDNFKDEFHFLRDYQLSIYKEEDRAEGRRIMRALIKADQEDKEEDNDSENSFLQELEDDPTSHVADYHFSSDELDWIKKHFKHSGNFLVVYGLKPFDDGDCREGKSILQSMMKDE